MRADLSHHALERPVAAFAGRMDEPVENGKRAMS